MNNKIKTFIIFYISLIIASSILGEERLKLATTTSIENTGLLKRLLLPFELKNNCKVDVIAVGTGQALKLGESGDVDVVLVHAPQLEEEFVKKGFGINRQFVMYNDFVIVGPPEDPAKIKGIKEAKIAFQRIVRTQTPFISRGDKSGTHNKELEIWKILGIKPGGKWYIESGKGMGEVLNIANEKRAYTLVDRGTFLAYQEKINLLILSEGDPIFKNAYHIIAVNPLKFQYVKYELASKLIEWVTSRDGQKIIHDYKDKNGNPFFSSVTFKREK